MRFIRRLLGLLVGLALIATVIAYLLPREVTVARSITVDAPASAVFPLVNSLQESARWSPWLGLDPDVRLAYSGPDHGVGNRLDWRSDHPKVGSGTQVITASDPDRSVASDLDFGDMGTARAAFTLEPAGTGTLVTWTLVADMGLNPVGRWMGLMMDRWVGTDYERGLINLRRVAEAGSGINPKRNADQGRLFPRSVSARETGGCQTPP